MKFYDERDFQMPHEGKSSSTPAPAAPQATPAAPPEAPSLPVPTSDLERLKQRLHAPGPSRCLGDWFPS